MNYGRPSTSGRGAIYYTSNRGIEKMGGSLAEEVSAPISTVLRANFSTDPLYVAWDNAQDTVMVRDALGADNDPPLIYNVRQDEWSTLVYGAPIDGSKLAALTPSIDTKSNATDHTRLIHYGYYETAISGTSAPTTGGNIRFVAALLDENTPTTGLVAWQWILPMIPLGLQYPDFSTGGFILDAYSLNSLPVTVTWTLYGGSSPYNIFQRDTNTMSFAGTLPSPWVSSRVRLSKKVDDAFILLKLTSTAWVAPVAVTFFDSASQVMR
jgi:WD40 repeat protein